MKRLACRDRWRAAAAAAALALALAPVRAWAYRPFDQTDAEVVEVHGVELELGPFAVSHGRGGAAYEPGFVLNYGVARRMELVVEDHTLVPIGTSATSQATETEPSVLLKGVVRQGVLQEQSGPSVALEAGVLLPSLPHRDGWGAATTLIVSYRWQAGTIHGNVEIAYSRDHQLAALGGAIIEGPHTWRIRPVAETFVEREGPGVTVVSALGGAIWTLRDNLSVDGAARAAREGIAAVVELRLGLTWEFAL
jgi:hypothetical protein